MCRVPNFVVFFSLSSHYESFNSSCHKLPTPSPSNNLLSCSFLVSAICVSTFSWALHSITFQQFVFLFLSYFNNSCFNIFMSTTFHHLLVASFIVSYTFSFTFITITSLAVVISSTFHCLPRIFLLGTNSFTFQELSLLWFQIATPFFLSCGTFFKFSFLTTTSSFCPNCRLLELLATTTLQVASFHFQ